MSSVDIAQVADGIFLVHDRLVNWILLVEGTDVTLVDSGYPHQGPAVEDSIRQVGRDPGDLRAVLVTHAHTDHIGSAARLARAAGAPVLMDGREVPLARREVLHQVTPGQVVANAWRPGVLPWAVAAVRAGGTVEVDVPDPTPLPTAGPLDLPGRAVAVPTPGHTPGHTCYHLPAAGVLISGDTLVTAHPTSRRHGPQLLLPMFDTDRAATVAALDTLQSVPADVLLPGHGPAWRGNLADAVATLPRRAP
jgi:glyoxylase-like metal-dependent hydrolase (beta-lactamase superfamily II)